MFKLLRHSLGLSAFGVQILQMPPNAEGYPEHDHSGDGQEELYAVLGGSAKLVADGDSHELEPGVYARVGAGQNRTLEPGDQGVKMLIIGGVAGRPYEPGEFSKPKSD